MKKKTVGEQARDLMMKEPETLSPIEIQKASEADYLENLQYSIDSGVKKYTEDFFIVVITKREKILHNTIRNYFTHRQSCPTPDYDQTVYKYDKIDDCLELIWVIPSKDACIYLLNNAPYVPVDEYELLGYIQKFESGELYIESKKLNGENLKTLLSTQIEA